MFRLAGITVYLHWSWFLLVAYVYIVGWHREAYSSVTWNLLELVALFVIVLMHEFGHSLACRQVGGKADQIVLWPFGGVAYVAPPHRPGATLWSIAAGPLVNVALFPVFSMAVLVSQSLGLNAAVPNVHNLLVSLWFINCALLVFNLLPIYPLDGGQILRSLLWFVLGPARSLLVAATIGMVGVVVLLLVAIWGHNQWVTFLGIFILLNCGRGLMQARAMARMEAASRRAGYACPTCRAVPPTGDFWVCGRCRKRFDLFQNHGVCPHCGTGYAAYPCLECGALRPLEEWIVPGAAPPR